MKKILLSSLIAASVMLNGCAVKEELTNQKIPTLPGILERNIHTDAYIVDLSILQNCPQYETIFSHKTGEPIRYIKSISTNSDTGEELVEYDNLNVVNSKEIKGCITNVNNKRVLLIEVNEQTEKIIKNNQ